MPPGRSPEFLGVSGSCAPDEIRSTDKATIIFKYIQKLTIEVVPIGMHVTVSGWRHQKIIASGTTVVVRHVGLIWRQTGTVSSTMNRHGKCKG